MIQLQRRAWHARGLRKRLIYRKRIASREVLQLLLKRSRSLDLLLDQFRSWLLEFYDHAEARGVVVNDIVGARERAKVAGPCFVLVESCVVEESRQVDCLLVFWVCVEGAEAKCSAKGERRPKDKEERSAEPCQGVRPACAPAGRLRQDVDDEGKPDCGSKRRDVADCSTASHSPILGQSTRATEKVPTRPAPWALQRMGSTSENRLANAPTT